MNVAVARDGSVFVATRSALYRLEDRDGDGQVRRHATGKLPTPIVRLDTKGDYPHNGLSGFAFDYAGKVYFGLGENLGARLPPGRSGRNDILGRRRRGEYLPLPAGRNSARASRHRILEPVSRGVRHVRAALRGGQRSRFASSLPLASHRRWRRLRLSVPQRPEGTAPVHRLERRAARHAGDGRGHRGGAFAESSRMSRTTSRKITAARSWSPRGATIASNNTASIRMARRFGRS